MNERLRCANCHEFITRATCDMCGMSAPDVETVPFVIWNGNNPTEIDPDLPFLAQVLDALG